MELAKMAILRLPGMVGKTTTGTPINSIMRHQRKSNVELVSKRMGKFGCCVSVLLFSFDLAFSWIKLGFG